MARIGCPCGSEISTAQFPSPSVHHLISDADLDAVTHYGVPCPPGMTTDDEDGLLDVVDRDRLDARKREVYECGACGRLLVFGESECVVYAREAVATDDAVRDMLRKENGS